LIALKDSMRWFGPDDPVSLRDMKQCGCAGVITSLHHIPYGELWTRDEITKRKAELAEAGLEWVAAESVPVSENIKYPHGRLRTPHRKLQREYSSSRCRGC
jgi:mannonate dehydratase